MSAGAGTPLAVIEAELAERGQELMFEPADYGALLGADAGSQTIGGVFAANVAGPRRLKSGAARDHLLGLHCVTGHAQEIKTGGRVVKNVTGYDLCKLLTGSWGTLAVLTQVTFKVMPRAEDALTLLATGADEAALLGLLRAASGSPCEISGAAYLPPLAAGRSQVKALRRHARGTAAIRLEGFGPSIAYRKDLLEKLLAAPGIEFASLDGKDTATLWREIRDVALLHPERMLWRISVPPTAASELVELDGRAHQRAPVRLGRRPDLAGAQGSLGQGRGHHPRGAGRARRACDLDARARPGCAARSSRSSRSRRRCGR